MNKISIALACGLVVALTGCDLEHPIDLKPSTEFKSEIIDSINNKLTKVQIEYYCLEGGKEPPLIEDDGKTYIFNPIDRSVLNNLSKADENVYQKAPDPQNSSDLKTSNYYIPVKPDEINVNSNITYYRKISSPLIICGQPIQNPEEQAKRVRNSLIDQAISYINANYEVYVNDLYLGRAGAQIGADIFEKAIIGTTAVINPATEVTRALTIGLGTFQGARSSIDKYVFQNSETQLLINQMDISRGKILANIQAGKTKETSQYSLSAAITDLVGYYNAGTLVRAITNLSQDTASRAAQVRQGTSEQGSDVTIPSVNSEALIVSINSNTTIKKLPIDSSQISPDQKVSKLAGSIFEIKSYKPAENNHWELELISPINGETKWFVFRPHVTIINLPKRISQ